MTMTRPRGEQLRLESSRTGSHILDDYLEAAELGDRTLADILSDIFDAGTGLFRPDIFEFRESPTNPGIFQFRVGDFIDPDSGWQDMSYTDFSAWIAACEAAQAAAETAEANAEAARNLAQKWAANPENVVVSGTLYSSLHYAAKSSQSATTSANWADASANSASSSSASATNAATSAINAAASESGAATSAANSAASESAAANSASDAANSAAYVASIFTAANILTELKTVDGAGSGLDADFLDGQSSAYYTDIVGRLGYTPLNKAGDTITGTLTFDRTLSSSNMLQDWQQGYGLFSDNTSTVGSTRLWINAPNGGQVVISPRAGGTKLTDFTVTSAAVNFTSVTTFNVNGNTVWHGGNDGSGSGLDADLLDGQEGSFYRNVSNFNAGTLSAGLLPGGVLPVGAVADGATDFDTLTATGWQPKIYLGANPHGPGDSNYYWVLNLVYGGSNITQLAIHYASPATTIQMRGKYAGTWSAWKKIAMADDYVPKTGGTFTGNVYLDSGAALYVQNGPTNDYAATFRANSASWGAVLGWAQNGSVYGILGSQNAYSFQGKGTVFNDGPAIFTEGITTNAGVLRGTSGLNIVGTLNTSGDSGFIYLRPCGYNTSAGQAYVDYNGNFFVTNNAYAGGNVLISSATLATYIASMGVGALGTYAFCALTGGGTASPGAGFAGSQLRYADANGGGATSLPGSWKCMGQIVSANQPTLFLRYA